MDETSPPTAVELGISDVEYERIMRDLRQRGRIDEPPTPLTFSAPSGDRPPRRRLAVAVVLGLVAAVLVVGRLGASDPDPVYKFIQTVDGRPVTYSSCRPIQVSVYPAGGPSDAEALVREAVDQMRSATGLDIVVAGVFGGYAPNWNFEAGPVYADDPISISWQDGEAIAHLTDHVAGLGGSRVLTGPRKRLVAGTVALSRDYYALLEERDDHSEALAVLLHELGHVFGLDHVDSPRELMYHGNNDQTGFGPGDLEGLRLLGQGPCS